MIYEGFVWRINILIALLVTTAPQRDCFFTAQNNALAMSGL